VEANFHSIRNSGVWHFRWDLGISLSARIDKAIVRPRPRASLVIRPEWSFEKFFGVPRTNSLRHKIFDPLYLFYRERQSTSEWMGGL
jgi:hypothetical protein